MFDAVAMVFLTMLPHEFEHTKEPAYNDDFRWLPELRLQPFSNMTPSTKESTPIDGCSSRQSGGDMTDVGSSVDIPALPENELSREHPEAMGNTNPSPITPESSLKKWTTSDGLIADPLHASSTEFLPPANAKNLASLETSVEALLSEDCMTENEIPISIERLRSNETNLLGELGTFQSKPLAVHCVPALTLLPPFSEECLTARSRAGSISSSETIVNSQEFPNRVVCSNSADPVTSNEIVIKSGNFDHVFNSDCAEPIALAEKIVNSGYPDAIVGSSTVDLAAEKTEVREELRVSTNPYLQDRNPTCVIPVENRQGSVDCKARTDGPSIAISCPATVSATDPPSTRLRHMIANSPSIILCPGVYDGLSARIALHVGFRGMYMTGAGTTASCLGASDLGIAHLHDMQTNAAMIANLEPDGPPLIADMDTGYGGPLIISRAVKQYARAGVAAFHIEDQVPEKRCGHLSGKEVVDVDTYLRRIRSCLDARAQIRSDIIIIARTDALQSRGYEECIERLRRARDLGADMGILEGVLSKEMARQAVKDLAPWPLCYNSVENGHSPLITAAEAQEMGYRLMIFSFAGIAPAYMAILETFTRLKELGVTGSMVGPKKIFEVCGLAEEMRIDEVSGGSAFAKGL